ncbi:hypothetical protein V8F06_009956 [Rhypophila decipiens]
MKYEIATVLLGASLASAGPLASRSLHRREVPQEHSHNFILDLVRTSLNLNNPKGIVDPVFCLLGNAAAAAGAGTVTNLDCLQMETADQAFTNAKAAGDIPGMAGALMFRAIERNTLGVGVKSVLCTETAVNPEIAALTQHQDPASDGAAAINKAITLELAKQLALIGADPLLALETGTFAPGDLNDATGRGNACDTDPNDPGCIFTDRLLVLDASIEEVQAAVADITPTFTGTGVLSATHIDFAGLTVANGGVMTDAPSADVTELPGDVIATATDDECTQETVTVTVTEGSVCSVITTTVEVGATTLVTAAPVATQTATPVDAGVGANVQPFTGTLGGPAPPVVSGAGDRPFAVNGNTFNNIGAALIRSCDIQNNACFNAVNSGALAGGTGQCADQLTACKAASAGVAKRQAGAFGSCSNPTIVFKAGLDGRREESFIPDNLGEFSHGSALNIGIIASFICERLRSSCKAGAAIVSACETARQAAIAAQQNQAAADAFNRIVLGAVGGAAAIVTAAPVAAPTPSAQVVVMTVTQCS